VSVNFDTKARAHIKGVKSTEVQRKKIAGYIHDAVDKIEKSGFFG
jgi:hypothetical protein